jgi:hypothetical protein
VRERRGDWGDEVGQTDYILLLLSNRVMHSFHSFLADAPQSDHSEVNG